MNVHLEEGRFKFGKNWQQFLKLIDDKRIEIAEESLKRMLGLDELKGMTFIDIGSGSGLFSLAAKRLGAEKLVSFDYDAQSVACSKELKNRYFPDDDSWIIKRGDALDGKFISSLGQYDIVYSWGVLHHTGNMHQALKNVCPLVKDNGTLFIAIYNDQGRPSRRWKGIKRNYSKSSKFGKFLILTVMITYFEGKHFLKNLFTFKNPLPFRRWKEYKKRRGMSKFYDYIDWIGGYPFEVARPEEIFHFYRERGFTLEILKTCGCGLGNNEFVFKKIK